VLCPLPFRGVGAATTKERIAAQVAANHMLRGMFEFSETVLTVIENFLWLFKLIPSATFDTVYLFLDWPVIILKYHFKHFLTLNP
jgi:hypothetical protein